MTAERTGLGLEIETALGEVLGHVRGGTARPCRIADDHAAGRITALRKRFRLSRRQFAGRFGLDARALQEWEQGRRVPDRAARVLLAVIDRDPEAVVRALGEEGNEGRAGPSPAS
ncbi:MAG: transcriptional regulator [Alphaproteobacteria bacterium]|nr:transcriptional regulator [Alphaproteobacteria bacterium]